MTSSVVWRATRGQQESARCRMTRPQRGGRVDCRRCPIGWSTSIGIAAGGAPEKGRMRRMCGARVPLARIPRPGRCGLAPGPAPGPPRAGAGWLSIATNRRRRSTRAPGDASSRVPTAARGAVRPSGRTPIYSGRAASSSSRRSIYSRAAEAAADGDRAGPPAVRSPGGRHKAARRARDSGRTADRRAVRAEPRRRAASRCRQRWRSIRWRATTSVDSWRVLFCIRGRLTLACRCADRVTRAVKAVTACHGSRRPPLPVLPAGGHDPLHGCRALFTDRPTRFRRREPGI